jgi:hypothetical protein
MIDLVGDEQDDAGFLALARRIINGAIMELQVREVFLVKIDNWFDHKWLGWRSRKDEHRLRVPLFTPNRVRSEEHFVWDEKTSAWKTTPLTRPLHVSQPGRPWLSQPIDHIAQHAAIVWNSGNSAANKMGSVMLYLSGSEGYSWYASLKKGDKWVVDDERLVTKRELLSFEQRGQELEHAPGQ